MNRDTSAGWMQRHTLIRKMGGHNQAQGNIQRPVVVSSNNPYNQEDTAVVFPITSKMTKSRYLLPVRLKKPSQIILTQVLGYDMRARHAEDSGYRVSSEKLSYLKQVFVHMV